MADDDADKRKQVKEVLDEEEIKYFVKPHLTRPNQKAITIYCGNELVASFYMHSHAGRRYCVFMSKHLTDVYTDTRNPLAPGVIIDLGPNPTGPTDKNDQVRKEMSRNFQRQPKGSN